MRPTPNSERKKSARPWIWIAAFATALATALLALTVRKPAATPPGAPPTAAVAVAPEPGFAPTVENETSALEAAPLGMV